jgi:hypothetical protein
MLMAIVVSLLPYITIQEDETLTELVRKYGFKRWSFIAKFIPGRIGKQCRER